MRNRDLKKGGAQGVWLRSLRAEHGLHQADLAERLEISRAQVSFYESGGEIAAPVRARLESLFPTAATPWGDSSEDSLEKEFEPGATGSGRPASGLAISEFPAPGPPAARVLPLLGSVPSRGRFEPEARGESHRGVVAECPPGLFEATSVFELARPFETLQAGDLLYVVPAFAARPDVLCLIEDDAPHPASGPAASDLPISDLRTTGRLEIGTARFAPDGEPSFSSPLTAPTSWSSPRVVARIVAVLRRHRLGGHYWLDPSGLRAGDLMVES